MTLYTTLKHYRPFLFVCLFIPFLICFLWKDNFPNIVSNKKQDNQHSNTRHFLYFFPYPLYWVISCIVKRITKQKLHEYFKPEGHEQHNITRHFLEHSSHARPKSRFGSNKIFIYYIKRRTRLEEYSAR